MPNVPTPVDACEISVYRLNVVIRLIEESNDNEGGFDRVIARDVLIAIRNELDASEKRWRADAKEVK